jgi:dTDP-4-dehydrorhamnose reductase
VHYSTDYVFDGTKDGPYAETDHPVPLGVYGRSKAIGDAAVLASGAPHLVLRIAWVYGQRPGNFMTTMLKLFGERETVRVVDDEIGGPTWCRDVADATVRTLAALSPGGELGSPEGLASRVARAGGVYHLSPAGFTSWHGFATEIAALAAASASVPMQLRRLEPIPAHEWVSAADRPRNSRLDSGRLLGELGVSIPDWREGLSRCFAGLARRSSPAHR